MKAKFVYLCSTMSAFALPATALAQVSSPSLTAVLDMPTTNEASSAPDEAATAPTSDAAGAGGIEDIVVTAQRRSERLQDVPVSVAAINSARLADTGVTNVQNLGQVVPSLSVSNAVGFTITFLRGVGSTAIGPGIENPISIYLDGVYFASTSSSLFEFSNIERVEVLKGPQGTLFGRNATGGLIQVFTRDPGQDVRMTANAGYGNYDTVKGDLYASGGIFENLVADFSLQFGTQGKGWGRNLANGDDVYRNDHNVNVRSKWVFTPSDSTKFTLIGDYADQENSFNGVRAPVGTVTLPVLGVPPQGGDEYDQNGNITPRFTNKNYGVSLKFEQDFGFASLMNLAAYRKSRSTFDFDVDFTPVPHLDAHLREQEEQFSEEIQLSSQAGGPLTWQAGGFYFRARGKYDPAGVRSADVPTNLFGPFEYVFPYGNQLTESVAGFGQATYEFLPDTNLTLGARYTWEKRTLSGYSTGILFGGSDPILLDTTPKKSASFDQPTFRVALDHRFSPEVLVYVSFNTGFKSGGFNTQFVTDPPFRPEKIKAYEAGVKTDLFDRNLRLNLGAFYYDYKDIQVQKVGLASTGIINGASARIYGAEAEFEAALTDAFNVNGSVAYTNAKFEEFRDAPTSAPAGGVPVLPGDASGNDIPKSPRFQATVNGSYRIDLADGAALHLNTSYTYNSGYALEADNIMRQNAFDRVNASIRWVSADDRYSVRVWGNNLTDERVINYGSTLSDGTHNVSYEAPRSYGVTFGVKFD